MGLTEILDLVYSELSLSENVDRNPDIGEIIKGEYKEIWRIDTEVGMGSFQRDVELQLAFDEFFPYTIPRIYLSKRSFEEIYPIPHLDKNRFICTYRDETTILDVNKPFEIVTVFIQKAKKIIKEGLENVNSSDFKDELKAYWTDSGGDEFCYYLSLLNDFPYTTTSLKVFKLRYPFNGIKKIVFKSESDITVKRLFKYLKSKGYTGDEYDALFIPDFKLGLKPPYPSTNENILQHLSDMSRVAFKKYINLRDLEKTVFFMGETLNEPILLGWEHKKIKTKRNGFRNNYLTPYRVLSTIQKQDIIKKIIVEEYNNKRVEQRTTGIIQDKLTFLVAGLGSIGSNLVYFLNGFNHPNFKLVDADFLKIENIGRHLLGVDNVNTYKVDAIQNYIKDIRPDQNVSVKKSTIETVINQNTEYLNNSDYVFIAIGNQNIENFILKKQNEGIITAPMFFLWVEPYALGGHCVFLHPDEMITGGNLYEDHFYRYNVITSDEYKNQNPILTMKEAGRQVGNQNEAGGIILGQVYENNRVCLTEVSEPNEFDKSSRFSFVRDKRMAQLIVNEAFHKSGGKLIYLGEWHTHPEQYPRPSEIDKRMIKRQFEKNRINESFLILLIQGTEDIYAAIYNGKKLIERPGLLR